VRIVGALFFEAEGVLNLRVVIINQVFPVCGP